MSLLPTCVGLLLAVLGLNGSNALSLPKVSWTYTFVESGIVCDDVTKLNASMRVERVGRSKFGLTGDLDLKIPIDGSAQMECLVYRSTDGRQYQLQPLGVPRQGFMTAVNGLYKSLIMESFKSCSNFPQFEEQLDSIEPKIYSCHACEIDLTNFPNYMFNGYYKIVLYFYGSFNAELTVVILVEKKFA